MYWGFSCITRYIIDHHMKSIFYSTSSQLLLTSSLRIYMFWIYSIRFWINLSIMLVTHSIMLSYRKHFVVQLVRNRVPSWKHLFRESFLCNGSVNAIITFLKWVCKLRLGRCNNSSNVHVLKLYLGAFSHRTLRSSTLYI